MVSVADMVGMDGDWLWARFETILPPYICLHIAAIKGPQANLHDAIVGWKCCADGKFSISSTYQVHIRLVAGGEDKDLIFSASMWELWRSRNAIVFETPIEGYSLIVDRSHAWVTTMRRALDSKARGAIDETCGGHGLVT
ncbi:hypothetical protein V6N11_082988 [Hibiscus sabdariffa]|uniref:Uncharacterized protein n=1 Tax=Hibiscus sabdariffa TaxID=183260 RepID=A0ABR2QKI3_9ROSI